jgi:hypothetical protein
VPTLKKSDAFGESQPPFEISGRISVKLSVKCEKLSVFLQSRPEIEKAGWKFRKPGWKFQFPSDFFRSCPAFLKVV